MALKDELVRGLFDHWGLGIMKFAVPKYEAQTGTWQIQHLIRKIQEQQ